MRQDRRSTCPISTGLELLGDRWTLLVIRDLMFAGKRHFREFLQSEEAISSNVLADRLNSLVESGIVTKSGDPTHAQKAVYSLTEKGLELLPVLVADERVDPEALSQDAPARSRAARGGGIQVREGTRATPSARTRHPR